MRKDGGREKCRVEMGERKRERDRQTDRQTRSKESERRRQR